VTSGYWNVGDLAAGESTTLQIWTTINTVGQVCNRATVVALDQHDPVTGNNSKEACVTVGAAPAVDMVPLSLDSGLNLISLPLIPNTDNVVIATTGVDVNTIDMYLKSAEDWRTYYAGFPPPEAGFVWEDGVGYWVYMNSADDLDIDGVELVSGTTLPPSYEVFGKGGSYTTGWNLIGFKSTTAKAPSEYLAGIEGKYVMIYGFDNGAFFAVGSPGHAKFEMGHGYWLAIKDGESGTIFP